MLARTIALLTVALIGGCGGPAAEAPAGASCFASADLLATEDQDNGMVPLYPGQALEVRLRGNSTIYPPLEWSLAAAPPDSTIHAVCPGVWPGQRCARTPGRASSHTR